LPVSLIIETGARSCRHWPEMIALLANPDHPNRFGMISVLAMITPPYLSATAAP